VLVWRLGVCHIPSEYGICIGKVFGVIIVSMNFELIAASIFEGGTVCVFGVGWGEYARARAISKWMTL